MDQSVLKVEKLTKDYGAYRAVDNVSFEIKKGQVVGLLGPNGAGKTTTIQMLVGITNNTAGKILYFGKDFVKNHKQSLQRINFTSAYNTLLGRISVKENLMTFAGLYQIPDKANKVAQLLDKFEISRLANSHYIDLSAGERTRVNLAKSLLNDPELILMDEPTASLDPDIADKTLGWIEELRNDRSLSILYTSHNMAEVERICDDVIFLDKGKVVSRGSPAEHTSKFTTIELRLTYRASRKKLEELFQKQQLDYRFEPKNVAVIMLDKAKTAETIAAVHDAGIQINDSEILKPDLEHVFLELARNVK